MSEHKTEELVAVGKWLYAGTTECVVHIVRRNIAFGSGDYQDPPEVREDREGTFYCLKFFSPADSTQLSSVHGDFDSIELAKHAAKRICTNLTWESDHA